VVAASIAGVMVAATSALVVLIDLPFFLASGIWIAPVVVLIPYAFRQDGRRAYELRTVVLALALPAIAGIWVVRLVLTRGVIRHHP
jgi:uncharacterized membrane protein YqjE